jgi:hypothetical protein
MAEQSREEEGEKCISKHPYPGFWMEIRKI